jgi:ribokinase
MEKKKITIVGSYNVGFFFIGESMPTLGETIMGKQFLEGGGGKGSNQAVACASFDGDTTFIGKLGADKYAIDAIKMYKERGISIDRIKFIPDTHTGMSVMIVDNNGNNMISVVPGANFLFSQQDIDDERETIKSSYITGFQLENNHDTVFYGIRKAKEWGATTYLDPAPAASLPDDLYNSIDIIKPNETEATIITGIKVKDVESAKKAGYWLLKKGVKNAIITLGEKGAVLVSNDQEEYFPAPEVKAVDTTGAGDLFSGCFLASLTKGKAFTDAIKSAICAASLSTTKVGVIEAIPNKKELEEFISKYQLCC